MLCRGPMATVAMYVPPTEKDSMSDVTDAAANPHLIAACLRICLDYQVSAPDLQNTWDTLTMNNQTIKRMSLETLAELEPACGDRHIKGMQT